MLHYKTLNQAKQNLPAILDRINDLKLYFDTATMILKDMERWCIQESMNESLNHGWWTTLKAYHETVKNQMQYLSEIEYLEDVIKKIQLYPQI